MWRPFLYIGVNILMEDDDAQFLFPCLVAGLFGLCDALGLDGVVRDGGSVAIGHPGTRHNTGKKNAASNRNGRKQSTLSQADANRFKKVIY